MKALKHNTPKQVGKRLAQLREQRGWSQHDLARRLGVAHPVIYKLENGLQVLNADLIPLLAETLGVTPADFFVQPEESPASPIEMARLLIESMESWPPEQRRSLDQAVNEFIRLWYRLPRPPDAGV